MKISNKKLLIVFVCIYIAHIIFSIQYGLTIPWGGDEWFSYKNFTLMGLPFSIITSLLKEILGQVNTENYILYRAQGLIWSSIAYYFLYRISTKSDYDELSKFAIFIAVFLGLNPFFLETSQFFRYYQLYITSSIIITFGILKYDSVFRQRRKWFYIALFSSFLIHLFLFIQFIVYIIFKELFQLNRKNIILILTTFGFVALLIIPNLPSILVWSWHNLFPAYAFDFSLVHRGFSLSTLLKPFMIIFTFMFGNNLSPFSYFFLDIIYIIAGIGIIYGIYFSLKNKPELRSPILFTALLPLFVSVFIIEPISLPKMTQLAPQHVIFLFPWVAFIFFQLWCLQKLVKL